VKAMFKARFKVHSLTDFGNDNVEVKMTADTNSKSDFAKYTPSGELKFMCTNPEVNKQLAPGKTFEITFSEFE
jgi:hypothetical protein